MKSSKLSIWFVLLIWFVSQGCFATCFDKKSVKYDENQFELPEMKDTSYGMYIQREYYSMVYSHKLFHAKWVAFQLINGKIPKIKLQTSNKDFKSEMYQRGHLVPNRYLQEKKEVKDNEHDIYNIVPQTSELNQGVWKNLENNCNNWSKHGKIGNKKIINMYITAGCISNENSEKLNDKITIPDSLFKVILIKFQNGRFKAIGYVIPNDTILSCLCTYAVTVDSVESLTTLDFFHKVNNDYEEKIESEIDEKFWRVCNSKCTKKSKKKSKK